MKKEKEFYIGYSGTVGTGTKRTLQRFIWTAGFVLLGGVFLFGYLQTPAVNSSFDFGNPTQITGVYHESPYPMLRVQLAANEFKEIVLLGFGKSGPNPYLKEAREKAGTLDGKRMTIAGQLIYYNGKTLLEIDDSQKVTVFEKGKSVQPTAIGMLTVEGEIIDPKCYFGVMKPGYGKIHRSCAALCILGGIPPVLVSKDANKVEDYFLLTDMKGNPLHKDILPYIGQPSRLIGQTEQLGEWKIMRIAVSQIVKLDSKSSIY
ncbi:MAG: hypothetical protein AAF634_07415 [Bacteroidota bacterium]